MSEIDGRALAQTEAAAGARLVVTSAPQARSAVRACDGSPSAERFAHISAYLGFDDPEWLAPRRAAVLAALDAASRLTPAQLRTMVRAQRPRLSIRGPDREIGFDCESRAALGCVREEARLHGRLVALGQAWAASNRVAALLTVRQPLVVVRVTAAAVAGEVLCRVLDDVDDRRVLGRGDEELLRCAWRAAHPPPAYFRRRGRERSSQP